MSENKDVNERNIVVKHIEIFGLSATRFTFTTRILRVRIINATGLVKKDIFGRSDPYCKLSLCKTVQGSSLIGSIVHTKTIKKTLNPRWNEEFLFRVNDNENKLVVEMYDENRLARDNFIGVVSINLPQLDISTESVTTQLAPKSFKLRSKSGRSNIKGNLIIYLAYLPNEADPDSLTEGQVGTVSETVPEVSHPTDDSLTSEPLPPQWEERIDQNGRSYYVNHGTKRTQWDRPINSPLPDGWEERLDKNGPVFYVDHINNKRHSEHPSSRAVSSTEITHNIVIGNQTTGQSSTNILLSPTDVDAATMFLRRRQISLEDTLPSGNHHRTRNIIRSPLPTENENSVEIYGTDDTVGDEIVANIDVGVLPALVQTTTSNGDLSDFNHNGSDILPDDSRSSRFRSNNTSLKPIPIPSVNRMSITNEILVDLGSLPPGWEEREHTDGRIFFVDHNNKTTQWEDPRLNKLCGPAVPYSRNYKQKYEYFRSKLRPPKEQTTKFHLKVNRKNIFEDSYRLISNVKKLEFLKNKLWIEFIGEKGLDYGGVQREWFFLLSREMFNPYYGLFEYSATDNYTLQINPLSGVANDNHLRYFKFIGRVAGMAVYHGRLLDGFFIRPIYKMMLGNKITLKDMESVDLEYYRSLRYILDNDPADLHLSFSVDEERYGEMIEIDLVPGGRNKSITQTNKRQYIDCIINWRFVKRVEHQMAAFIEGFQDVIALNTLQLFDANELELLLCGLQDINVTDWKTNTKYKGNYTANHDTIVNFWKVVYTFNNELRARLLQFVTGTSRVPMNGFVELWGSSGLQKFTIEKWGNENQLPRAHTCFNRLDLPPYRTFDELRRKLLTAIENTEGFDGVD